MRPHACIGMMEVLPLNLCLSGAISEKSTFAFLFLYYVLSFPIKRIAPGQLPCQAPTWRAVPE